MFGSSSWTRTGRLAKLWLMTHGAELGQPAAVQIAPRLAPA